MVAVIFFLLISLAVIFGAAGPVMKEMKISQDLLVSKKSYFLAESGVEDLIYRIEKGMKYDNNETLTIGSDSTAISVSGLSEGKEIISAANASGIVRKVKTSLTTGSAVSFHYGVQVGDGGLVMQNNSLVSGNIYSNGPVRGYNSNLIKGDAVSAGQNGFADGIHATSSVYSHTISNSTVDKDAYYVNISNTAVGGSFYPGSSDKPTSTLPISDDLIETWKNDASVSVINSPCPYVVDSNISLGPVKINCDLEIKGSAIITLLGPVWVAGDFKISNTAVVKIDSSLGKKSVAIVADNPANRLTSSKAILSNSVIFQNSGIKGSYILVVSQNRSAEAGGSEEAIEIKNSVSGDLLLYSGHGTISLENSVAIKEVTAYKIELKNSANVIYETGLTDLLFESGPQGGYSVADWKEEW